MTLSFLRAGSTACAAHVTWCLAHHTRSVIICQIDPWMSKRRIYYLLVFIDFQTYRRVVRLTQRFPRCPLPSFPKHYTTSDLPFSLDRYFLLMAKISSFKKSFLSVRKKKRSTRSQKMPELLSWPKKSDSSAAFNIHMNGELQVGAFILMHHRNFTPAMSPQPGKY